MIHTLGNLYSINWLGNNRLQPIQKYRSKHRKPVDQPIRFSHVPINRFQPVFSRLVPNRFPALTFSVFCSERAVKPREPSMTKKTYQIHNTFSTDCSLREAQNMFTAYILVIPRYDHHQWSDIERTIRSSDYVIQLQVGWCTYSEKTFHHETTKNNFTTKCGRTHT